MTIWIVEDRDKDALTAKSVVEEFAQNHNLSVSIYRNRTIRWGSLDLVSGTADTRCEPEDVVSGSCPPTFVILDLYDHADRFQAERYYNALREWEAESTRKHPPAFVILWTVNDGMAAVQDWMETTPKRDRNLLFSGSKTEGPLLNCLERCLGALQDRRCE